MSVRPVNSSSYMDIGAIDLSGKTTSMTEPCILAKVAIVVAKFFRNCAAAVRDLVDLIGRVFTQQPTAPELDFQNPQIRAYFESNIANTVLEYKLAIANNDRVGVEAKANRLETRLHSLKSWFHEETEDVQVIEDVIEDLYNEMDIKNRLSACKQAIRNNDKGRAETLIISLMSQYDTLIQDQTPGDREYINAIEDALQKLYSDFGMLVVSQ